MPILKDQRGVLPLFLLIAIGIAVLAGGGYIIREQFIKTGQSGKSALDEKKIQEQINNSQLLPSLSPTPKSESQSGPFVYKSGLSPNDSPSDQVTGAQDNEPSFSIIPPAGWNKSSQSDPVIKVVFLSAEEDKEVTGDELEATNKAKVQINMVKGNGTGDLESFVNYYLKSSEAGFESLKIISKNKAKFAGVDAYKIEMDAFKKGVNFKTLSYVFIKGKYGLVVYGGALDSAWDKRGLDINNSLNSFKLLE